MSNNALFKGYLAVVCFAPMTVIAGTVVSSTLGLHSFWPESGMSALLLLFAALAFQLSGMLVLAIDLCRSKIPGEAKSFWTLPLLLAFGIAAPIYWYSVVRTRTDQSNGTDKKRMQISAKPPDSPIEVSNSPRVVRSSYCSSGKVGRRFYFLSIPIVVASALIGAGGMCAALWHGFYFAIVLPLLAGIATSPSLIVGVGLGRCRNRHIAAALGVVAGFIMYFGYYFFDMALDRTEFSISAIAKAPSHIIERLRTDEWEHTLSPGEPLPAIPFTNYLIFICELTVLCGVLAFVAVRRASQVYCECTDRWASHRIFFLPAGTAQFIASSLSSGNWDDCAPV